MELTLLLKSIKKEKEIEFQKILELRISTLEKIEQILANLQQLQLEEIELEQRQRQLDRVNLSNIILVKQNPRERQKQIRRKELKRIIRLNQVARKVLGQVLQGQRSRAENLLRVEKVRQDLLIQKQLEVLRENLAVAQKQVDLKVVLIQKHLGLVEARNQVSQEVVRKGREGRS